MVKDFLTISSADNSVLSYNAFAADCAKEPPDPIAIIESWGSITSPLPDISSDTSLSATISNASRLRRILSVRHSFASSTAHLVRWPLYFSSLPSNFSKSVKASAVAPAKPAITLSL